MEDVRMEQVAALEETSRRNAERRRLEQELRRREAELREAQRLARVGHWELDAQSGSVVWSEELYRIFGLDPDDPAPTLQEHDRFLTPESRERLSAAIEETQETGGAYEIDLEIIRPDGERRWLAARGEVKRDDNGNVTGFRGTAADITDRRRVEEALRQSRDELRRAQRLARIGSWSLDLATQELAWSEETYAIFRIPTGMPMTYQRFRAAVHPDDRDRIDQAWNSALQGRPYDLPHRIVADGETRWVLERAEVDFDAEGHAVRGKGVVMDITEQKRMEEEIRRFNKELEEKVARRTAELEAAYREMESYAYSAAHDLRGPLRGLDGFSQILVEDYGDRLDERGRDYLRRIRRGAQRLGRLIDDFSKLIQTARVRLTPAMVDLSTLAAEAAERLQQGEPSRRVDIKIRKGLVERADYRLCRELVAQLLDNAWKFSAASETVRIEFGRRDNGDERLYFVRDNGSGLDMAYVGKLFTPFQRLHDEQIPGTGIGLAICRRIIERHGGRIWAEAARGSGATIFFTLHPASKGENEEGR